MKIKTQAEARRIFRSDIQPIVEKKYGKKDTVALDEAWNNWIDMLCKDGQISERAYNTWTRS